MQILRIEPANKNRVLIHTDEIGVFPLYRKEVRVWEITEGGELSEEKWNRLQKEVLQKRIIHRALYLLQQQDRTESQLRKKLTEGHYPDFLVDEAIAYVKSFRYIDDFRYACAYIRYHQSQKSRLGLKLALQQRGVSGDTIAAALEEAYEGEEALLIQAILQKKHYDAEQMDPKEKHRIYQYLLRKGFSNSDIRRQMHLT